MFAVHKRNITHIFKKIESLFGYKFSIELILLNRNSLFYSNSIATFGGNDI